MLVCCKYALGEKHVTDNKTTRVIPVYGHLFFVTCLRCLGVFCLLVRR